MTDAECSRFQNTVQDYYNNHGRHDLPWRRLEVDGSLDPYKVLVSELMLQQTQVPRVVPKFNSFIQQFPNFAALASAPLADVLKAWNGLGYNRRAKFLWQSAGLVVNQHHGQLPDSVLELTRLPGIGPNTAGAIAAYAYRQSVVFIETNIRTVFIHHFFNEQEQVADKAIAELVAQTMPDDPRIWYWALMDYGTNLKQIVGNLNKLSKHYTKQSTFAGSRRQVRGQVLRLLGQGRWSFVDLQATITDERLQAVVEELAHEKLIHRSGQHYLLGHA